MVAHRSTAAQGGRRPASRHPAPWRGRAPVVGTRNPFCNPCRWIQRAASITAASSSRSRPARSNRYPRRSSGGRSARPSRWRTTRTADGTTTRTPRSRAHHHRHSPTPTQPKSLVSRWMPPRRSVTPGANRKRGEEVPASRHGPPIQGIEGQQMPSALQTSHSFENGIAVQGRHVGGVLNDRVYDRIRPAHATTEH